MLSPPSNLIVVLYSAQYLKLFFSLSRLLSLAFVRCDISSPIKVALKAKNIHNPAHSVSFAKEPTDQERIVPVFNI